LLGTIELRRDEQAQVLAYAQVAPDTDCDAREWSLDFLRRSLHEFRATARPRREDVVRGYDGVAHLLGTRLAQLHRVLAQLPRPDAGPAPASALAATQREAFARVLDRCSNGLLQRRCATPRQIAELQKRIDALCDEASRSPALPLQRIHANLRLQNIRLGAGDLFYIRMRDPEPDITPALDRCAPALSDLADLLHGIDLVAEAFAHESDDGSALFATFLRRFRERARECLLGAYRGGHDIGEGSGDADPFLPWLDLLRLRRALHELERAPHSGALAAAWAVLRAGAARSER
jgi:maltose alpha-D-glucosyltransferase/alpha-amylase